MNIHAALLLAVFIIALSAAPFTGDTWFWEIGNGIGFVGFTGILILTENGRSGAGRGKRHRHLGLAVMAIIWIHALWFLLGDAVTVEYIKWGAPAYMVAGLLALLLCTLLSFSSLKRFRQSQYRDRQGFRHWHRWLSTVVLLAGAWHMVASGYYFRYTYQWILLAMVAAFAYAYPRLSSAEVAGLRIRQLAFSAMIVLALFTVLRIVPQTILAGS